MNAYERWIAATVCGSVRGRCGGWTRRMQRTFPELRLVGGFVARADMPPWAGTHLVHAHWWLVTPAGRWSIPPPDNLAGPWSISRSGTRRRCGRWPRTNATRTRQRPHRWGRRHGTWQTRTWRAISASSAWTRQRWRSWRPPGVGRWGCAPRVGGWSPPCPQRLLVRSLTAPSAPSRQAGTRMSTSTSSIVRTPATQCGGEGPGGSTHP